MNSKKRKFGLSSQTNNSGHPSPSIGGPFSNLTEGMQWIRDLVVGLSKGPGETSEGPPSCVSKKQFQKYLDDQKRQGDYLKKLEKAYTDLATTHCALSTSHTKQTNSRTMLRKMEKMRDKLFTQIWKGVKGHGRF